MKIDPARILGALYEQDLAKYFAPPGGVALFDPPMVAVAAADYPWFARFKQTIGDFHWTPTVTRTPAGSTHTGLSSSGDGSFTAGMASTAAACAKRPCLASTTTPRKRRDEAQGPTRRQTVGQETESCH